MLPMNPAPAHATQRRPGRVLKDLVSVSFCGGARHHHQARRGLDGSARPVDDVGDDAGASKSTPGRLVDSRARIAAAPAGLDGVAVSAACCSAR
jgi:hypothetical protein